MSRTIEEHYAGYASACARFETILAAELGDGHPVVQSMREARETAERLQGMARQAREGREAIEAARVCGVTS